MNKAELKRKVAELETALQISEKTCADYEQMYESRKAYSEALVKSLGDANAKANFFAGCLKTLQAAIAVETIDVHTHRTRNENGRHFVRMITLWLNTKVECMPDDIPF